MTLAEVLGQSFRSHTVYYVVRSVEVVLFCYDTLRYSSWGGRLGFFSIGVGYVASYELWVLYYGIRTVV